VIWTNSWEQALSKKSSKNSRSQGRRERKVATRNVRQRFLIVCEGEKTEPAYFKAFQVPGLVIKVAGIAESNLKLIRAAQKRQKQDEADYDQIWCVFDRDDCEVDQIRQAFVEAERLGYHIAFSNQAFELWYLLHFSYNHTALSRQDYCKNLSKHLGYEYQKNKKNIYNELQARQEEAIKNARRLLEQYDPWQPAHCDPSTTVHLLVEELNKHRRP
jgi:hypothetical protein